jgi:hypothetical protein
MRHLQTKLVLSIKKSPKGVTSNSFGCQPEGGNVKKEAPKVRNPKVQLKINVVVFSSNLA